MATIIETFNTNYTLIATNMEATIDSQMTKLKAELAEYSITAEVLIDTISKSRATMVATLMQTSASSALGVIEQTQADALNTRRIQGFDDNMLMELTKMQGNVASFFVNSSPSGAQSVLDDLKEMMQIISKRAELVTGSQTQIPT